MLHFVFTARSTLFNPIVIAFAKFHSFVSLFFLFRNDSEWLLYHFGLLVSYHFVSLSMARAFEVQKQKNCSLRFSVLPVAFKRSE